MPYCVQTDIEKRMNATRLIELADDDGNGAADTGVIAAIIEEADGLLYSAIARRYPDFTPTVATSTTTPKSLRSQSVSLAIYLLEQRQNRHAQADWDRIFGPDGWATQVADGRIVLAELTEEQPEITTDDRAKVFSDRQFEREDGFGEALPEGGSGENENIDPTDND